jgi:hypothetical protein
MTLPAYYDKEITDGWRMARPEYDYNAPALTRKAFADAWELYQERMERERRNPPERVIFVGPQKLVKR